MYKKRFAVIIALVMLLQIAAPTFAVASEINDPEITEQVDIVDDVSQEVIITNSNESELSEEQESLNPDGAGQQVNDEEDETKVEFPSEPENEEEIAEEEKNSIKDESETIIDDLNSEEAESNPKDSSEPSMEPEDDDKGLNEIKETNTFSKVVEVVWSGWR